MIFKTFDSKIDKWTAKIGIFGKSFKEFGTAVNDAIKSAIDNINNFDKNVGFWESLKSNLFSKKDNNKDWLKNSLGEIISQENIDTYIEQLDLDSAKERIIGVFNHEKLVNQNKKTWQDYFDTLDGDENYIKDLIKNTDDLSKLTGEDLVKANQQARASALAYNEAIKAQTFSAKAGKVALQALATAGNMLAGLLIAKTLQAAAAAIDNWIHRVGKANEAMDKAVGEYESAKSSLENVNAELEKQNKQLGELQSKGKLTYAEKGQLEELQAITQELLLQKDIEEKRAAEASKEAAAKAVDAYKKQYGRYGSTEEDLQEKLSHENFPLPEGADDVLGTTAAYIRTQELLEQSQKEFNEAAENGEDTTWLAEDVQNYIDTANDYRQALDKSISDLQEKRLALKDEYNKAIEKRDSGTEPLTSSEKEVIETYESIYDVMGMVYEYTANNAWKSMQIESVFNTEGIEKTKEELIGMVKAGTFDETTLQSYPKLSGALEQNKVSAGELRNELEALAKAEDNVQGHPIPIPTISSSVEQIAKQLEPQFAKLTEAYQSVFSAGDNGEPVFQPDAVDNSMLEGLRQSFAEIGEEIGVTFRPSLLNPFFDTLTDKAATAQQVQDAFRELATAYLYSTDTLAQLDGETAGAIEKQLEQMGVANANEIVTAALAEKELELAASKEYLARTSGELADATGSEIAQFGAQQVAAGQCSEALALFYLKKVLLNTAAISTSADVENVLTLANAAGVSTESLTNLAQAKAQFDLAVKSGNAFQLSGAYAAMQIAISKVKNDISNFKPVEVDLTKAAPLSKAQSAGAQAADAYLEAFEEELGNLKDLKDRGTLTEKEYLDQLKRLYEQYFKDKSDYLDQYQKYEHEYLQGMKSLYESVFGTITKEYGKKIDAANKSKDAAIDALEEQKDAAVDALEAERDARLDALESQKDALQEQADAIEEQIAQKQKLIDGIHDEIDAIRDANQERENEISLQQKKYELERAMNQRTALVYRDGSLQYQSDPAGIREKREEVKNAETEMEIFQKEKQVKAIEKEISLLEERKDLIQEQQDAIDKQMDAISEHYDALIEQTEQQYDGMIRQTEQYWDTILSGFEEYKNRYEELADMEAEAKAMADLKQLCEEMGVTVDQVLGMSDEAFQAFRNNYTKTLAEIYSGNAQMTESLAQLTGMKQSVEGVAAAISGGGTVTGPGTDGQGPDTGSGTTGCAVPLTGALDELKKKSDSVLGSGGENADGESQAAGSGVIGRFNRLGQEVKNVTGAIGGGTGENTDGETNDTDAESLNGSLSALGTAAQNILGEPEGDGVTGRFQTLSNILGEANEHVNGIYDGLQNLDGEEAECTITVHIETTGGLPAGLAGATGTSLDTMNLNSARYGSRFARQEGMARVTGDWGVRGGGSTLVGELGQELVVFPNGRFRTVGDNGAEFVDIPDGSIIFNHLQTKELLRKGYLVGRGKVSGSMPPLTDGAAKAHTVTLTDGTVLMPVQPDDQAWDVVKKWDAYVERTGASPDILTNSGLIRYRRQMDAYTGHVNTINSITNNRNLRPNINVGGIHISCPGITSQEVARQVGAALENMFSGLHNYADQYARIR